MSKRTSISASVSVLMLVHPLPRAAQFVNELVTLQHRAAALSHAARRRDARYELADIQTEKQTA